MKLSVRITVEKDTTQEQNGMRLEDVVVNIDDLYGPPEVLAATLRGIAASLDKPDPKTWMGGTTHIKPYITHTMPCDTGVIGLQPRG